MSHSFSKKILIVPLDWGLGHTTRCIPIIRVFIELGHEVHIGGTPVTNGLLQIEFPNLKFYEYPSYGISYPKDGKKFLQNILKLSPGIAKAIKKERDITNSLNEEHNFDIILSDNRFGVRAKHCKNIFISHQLNLSVPQSKLAERVANYINRRFVNKFDKVGVPDWDNHLLSGNLSQKEGIKKEIIFLGNISRWEYNANLKGASGALVILSGPEPQRTMLEALIIEQSGKLSSTLTIVRAKPNEAEDFKNDNIIFYNHLSSKDLQDLVSESEIIISRAGYTTIMDLIAMKKNAILIPTPGQTEQEYLATHLDEMNLFTFHRQDKFDLQNAIGDFRKREWGLFPNPENRLREKIEELIA